MNIHNGVSGVCHDRAAHIDLHHTCSMGPSLRPQVFRIDSALYVVDDIPVRNDGRVLFSLCSYPHPPGRLVVLGPPVLQNMAGHRVVVPPHMSHRTCVVQNSLFAETASFVFWAGHRVVVRRHMPHIACAIQQKLFPKTASSLFSLRIVELALLLVGQKPPHSRSASCGCITFALPLLAILVGGGWLRSS